MQNVANIAVITPGLRTQIDLFFAAKGKGLNAHAMRRGRLGELARLDAMSDAELREAGITRAEIPTHVFRDIFSV